MHVQEMSDESQLGGGGRGDQEGFLEKEEALSI